MEVSFKTDKGILRSNNEDACFVLDNRLFIVADGVGGNNSGEIASKLAVDEIAKYFKEHPLSPDSDEEEIKAQFKLALLQANITVLEMSQENEENRGMATTIVACYISDKTAYIVNVGDSRAYLLRNDKLEQITEDHTYVNSLLKAGLISEEEAETHENRNMITRAIGANICLDVDFFKVSVEKGDTILLCTDGLYGELTSRELIDILQSDNSVQKICVELVDTANRNGGHDNITMVVLKITEEDIDE